MPGAVNPALDCNNDCLGTATEDECRVCTGGSTGLMANYLKDACGRPPNFFLTNVIFIKASFRQCNLLC